MTQKQFGFKSLPSIAISEGATTPSPGIAGVICWSSTLGKLVYWTGSLWTAGASIVVSATAPSSPSNGQEWEDLNTGILYTFVDDGSSTAWVELGPGGSGVNGTNGSNGTNGTNGSAGAAIVDTVAIANTETVVVAYVCSANELAAGVSFQIKAFCTQAGTNAATPTIRVRVGATTLTGNIAATLTGSIGTSAVASLIEGLLTVRTAGASGTIIGSLAQTKSAVATAINAQTGTVAVNTTAANLRVELTFISGQAANTYTFQEASMIKVVPQ